LKNFCFNEGVKVNRTVICTDVEFDTTILENNFFKKPTSSFCLVQQVSPDDVLKYYIFGIKFDDFYVTPVYGLKHENDIDRKKNYVNVFKYEKTCLFISSQPLFKLFEGILQTILNVKKINFLQNLSTFSYCFIPENKNKFLAENRENVIFH
jgi:hypothetical protein